MFQGSWRTVDMGICRRYRRRPRRRTRQPVDRATLTLRRSGRASTGSTRSNGWSTRRLSVRSRLTRRLSSSRCTQDWRIFATWLSRWRRPGASSKHSSSLATMCGIRTSITSYRASTFVASCRYSIRTAYKLIPTHFQERIQTTVQETSTGNSEFFFKSL